MAILNLNDLKLHQNLRQRNQTVSHNCRHFSDKQRFSQKPKCSVSQNVIFYQIHENIFAPKYLCNDLFTSYHSDTNILNRCEVD